MESNTMIAKRSITLFRGEPLEYTIREAFIRVGDGDMIYYVTTDYRDKGVRHAHSCLIPFRPDTFTYRVVSMDQVSPHRETLHVSDALSIEVTHALDHQGDPLDEETLELISVLVDAHKGAFFADHPDASDLMRDALFRDGQWE